MYVGHLSAGDTITLPAAPYVHLFVARGKITLTNNDLEAGDAARLTNANPVELTTITEAEIIVWESDTRASR